MNEVTLDVETTTFAKGNPFSKRNKLCSVGLLHGAGYSDFDIEYSSSPYGGKLVSIAEIVDASEVLIGFNIKFDLHWLRRYIDNLLVTRVWDCQLAEFLLNGQSNVFPSLSEGLSTRGLAPKLDVVRSVYWEHGLDTTEIPWDILTEYQKQDVVQTYELYKLQRKQFEDGDPRLYELFKIECDDLLCLEEIEFEGMRLDLNLVRQREAVCLKRMEEIKTEFYADLAQDTRLNINSPDHISVLLYGGKLSFKSKVSTKRVLKSGEVKEGEKWGLVEVEFPQLVKPLDRSESELTRNMLDEELTRKNVELKELGRRPLQRLYKVDEPTLKSIKGNNKVKKIVELLLEYSSLEKLYGTYYKGFQDKIEEMDWPENELHGQFNQCVVPTGRLSSSGPNLQNLAGESKALYVSRYP